MAPKRKIPAKDHKKILAAFPATSAIELARKYGVTRQAIYKILWGQTA